MDTEEYRKWTGGTVTEEPYEEPYDDAIGRIDQAVTATIRSIASAPTSLRVVALCHDLADMDLARGLISGRRKEPFDPTAYQSDPDLIARHGQRHGH